MTESFEYFAKNGWESEQDYKYTAKWGACAYDKSLTVGSNKGYETVPVDNDLQLMAAIVNGPVSVAIDMDAMYNLKGGVFTGCRPDSQTRHGSLVVGYGNENGQDFWLLKETLGTDFAEKGFIKIARGNHSNDCAITKQASYPTM
jgi:cathepsin L